MYTVNNQDDDYNAIINIFWKNIAIWSTFDSLLLTQLYLQNKPSWHFLLFAISTSLIIHPVCPPKFRITFVSQFFWVLQSSQEKLKTVLMQNSQGQTRCIMGDVEMANVLGCNTQNYTGLGGRTMTDYHLETYIRAIFRDYRSCIKQIFYGNCRNSRMLIG